MPDELGWRVTELERSARDQQDRLTVLETREAVREVKVQAATSAMNRLTVLFGTLIVTVLGALIAAFLAGGSH
ncbi:MAG TPA: hypothetical protein VFJ57_01350 [Solirubrobacterales bacterium]|nr:hypothetical protein [Solirubrobacterales bacterium]